MSEYLTILAVLLLLTLLGGLARVLRGPTAADRMLATQLFSTAGVGVLLLLAFAQTQFALLNVALALAVLAPLALIAFIRLAVSRS
jgi:multicomponent Na+:H+ antiporter subunit F